MKFFSFLLVFVFCLTLVSATDFDNKVVYSENDMKVTIENHFGINPLADDLGELTLASHKSVTHVRPVGYGSEEVVMYYDFENWSPYANGFGEVVFTDEKTGEIIDRDYSLVEWRWDFKTVNNYSFVKVKLENGTIVNQYQAVGKYDKLVLDWFPVTKNEVKNGRFGLKTFVEKDDYVDAVWTIAGKKITKHASWNATLENGLLAAYGMNETSGTTAYDYMGNLNLSETGSSSLPNEAGKVDKAWFFNADSSHLLSSSFTGISGTESRTVSAWFRMDSGVNDAFIFALGGAGPPGNSEFSLQVKPGRLYFVGWANDLDMSSTTFNLITFTWYHAVATYDGTTARFYIDGQNVGNLTTSLNTEDSYFRIGARDGSSSARDIWVDEVLLYNRSLSQAEVIDLYNEGDSLMPWTSEGCSSNYINESWSSWSNTSSCRANDTIQQTKTLNSYDNNSCASNITYYDYQDISCDYCTPSLVNTSWSTWVNTESCQSNDYLTQNRSLTQYDENSCGEVSNETFWDYQEASCNYCSYSVVNSSWSSWVDTESCQPNDFKTQNRSLIEYDENYSSCYLVTSLGSDLWNSGLNNTWWDYQEDSCDYCTPSMVNTSWSSWENYSSCYANDTLTQRRSKVNYDENDCGEVSNTTYYEYQDISCVYCASNYINESWSSWSNTSSCRANDTIEQTRTLNSYDNNSCGSNITYYDYQDLACDYCTPSMANTSWTSWLDGSCNISNQTTQSRYFVTYDTNNCGEITNVSTYAYQSASCIYVAPVESDSSQWGISVDFSTDMNRWLLFGSFAVAIALLFFRMSSLSIVILLVDGFVMLFSGVLWFFCMIPLAASVIIAGGMKK